MKVADLQDILGLIRQMLVSAGGKGAGELAEFSAALEPFRDLTAKQLTNELVKLTKPPKESKRDGKLDPAEVDALIDDVRALYDRAGSPTTTAAEIEAKTAALQKLGKSDLVRAAEAVGLKGMKSKSIAAIAAEIKKRIENRLGTRQRMELIEVVVGGDGR